MQALRIGLLGNPNAGKTTLFNQLTGSHQRVGNWPGVTVERKEGHFSTARYHINLTDLPGTYSLITPSEHVPIDEQITCHFVKNLNADLFINVVDASHLEGNLWLTLQLRELGVPCILVLNMLDIATSQNIHIDLSQLEKELGCPVVPLVSTLGKGINLLKEMIDQHDLKYRSLSHQYPEILQKTITQIAELTPNHINQNEKQWRAKQILEGDLFSFHLFDENTHLKIKQFTHLLPEDPVLMLADARHRTLSHIFSLATDRSQAKPHRLSQRLDAIVLNRWLGIPIFLMMMYMMFFLSISLGGALQPIFDIGSAALFIEGIQWIGITAHWPEALTTFLAQGLGGGLNTMLPLVPQIGLMYLFLSLMEDSGYMARAAFVIDRLMQGLGLPGKSFVPLIVGFGCNVPAIMGTRTLNASRERLVTTMMAPFMSCGARLAIFAVFSSAFFGQSGAFITFCLYIIGIIMAVLTGLILKYTLMRGGTSPFIMELPSWHRPHIKSVFLHAWHNLRGFIIRGGKVIIAASMLISLLGSFSPTGKTVDNINDSALASVSRVITPFLAPIGVQPDHWQATVGLITGAVAKEVVVGTLNTLYTAEIVRNKPFDVDDFNLPERLDEAFQETLNSLKNTFSMRVFFTPIESSKGDGEMTSGAMGIMSQKFGSSAAAFSYLLFVLLYVPCVSVMGAIARETHRRWMWFSVFWGLNLAYSLATLFWQVATFMEQPGVSSITISLVILFNILVLWILRQTPQSPALIPIRWMETHSHGKGITKNNALNNP